MQDKQEWQKNIEIHHKNKNNTLQDILSRKEKQLEDASIRCRQFQDTVKSLESQIMLVALLMYDYSLKFFLKCYLFCLYLRDKTQRIFALEKQAHMAKADVDSFKNRNEMLEKNLNDKDQNIQNVKSKLKDSQKVFSYVFYIL